jgi:hypothetical protein
VTAASIIRPAGGGTGFAIPTWALYAGLAAMMAVVFELGMLGIGVARVIFVVSCIITGYLAWRSSPAQHVECTIVLFAFAPFLRRVVDASTGYEPTGYMLTGPLLAILVPVIELRWLLAKRSDPGAWPLHPGAPPFILYGLCVLYAAITSLFQGYPMDAASGAVKWGAPFLYGVWLLHKAEGDESFVRGAARAFAIITPIMGVYGVAQYVNPLVWDRYWMDYAQMLSIGQPEPYQVRVFSTMNSPASFATYAACGLLLFGFARSGWQSIVLALPSSLGLLLSMYRTAWLALAAGVVFCLLFGRTRLRAVLILAALACAVVIAVIATPFGDAISQRLATFSSAPSQDGSGQERIAEYVALYNADASMLAGVGFTLPDPGIPGVMAVDGQIILAWLCMGLIVGLISLTAILWVAGQALLQVWRHRDPVRVTLGAITVGALVQIPLAGMAEGEIGVLFWVFAAIATTGRARGEVQPA